MAILANVTTVYGEDKELYVRLNSLEVSNHGAKAIALFRGFASQQAFEGKFHYLWEREVEFDADVTKPLWEQAYAKLKLEVVPIRDL